MFKIPTKNFPPNGYHAITIWPFLFYKGELTDNDVKHENVHQRQYLFCVLLGYLFSLPKFIFFKDWVSWPFIVFPFLLFYIIWGIGYFVKGYDNIKFEIAAKRIEDEYL
jgi:hypothetical protein